MSEKYEELRKAVCLYAKKMADSGWVTGASGNVSMRAPDEKDVYVITPTSVNYNELKPENIVVCDEEGDEVIDVENAPSFELPLHVAIYKARANVHAIFHTHAPYSTILSVLRKTLPPIVEEMVPYLGGEILVADYGSSGSDELAEAAVKALGDRAAALIANHGNVAVGKNMKKAFSAAALLEHSAMVYVESLKLAAASGGKVHLLPGEVIELEKEMYKVLIGDY
jgi:L-fuculose-phosphate aldolase